MSTSCSSSFTKLPGRSVTKLVYVNSKYLYLVSSLVFIILLKMGVRVVYTFKYEIYISCTWTLKHTFHWILQPCITGQTSQRPFDWSVPPMMSGSCSGIREGYVGASRSNVQHLHSQDGWHYVRLVHSVLFSGDLGREHTWQSPGHSVLASKPFYHQSPEYLVVVGPPCQSAMLAGSNQPHRFRSTSDAAINLTHRLQNRIAPPFSQHLSPLDVRFEVDDSSSDFSFPFVEIQRYLTNNISASLTYDRFEVMARARDRPAAGYAGETIQHQT